MRFDEGGRIFLRMIAGSFAEQINQKSELPQNSSAKSWGIHPKGIGGPGFLFYTAARLTALCQPLLGADPLFLFPAGAVPFFYTRRLLGGVLHKAAVYLI